MFPLVDLPGFISIEWMIDFHLVIGWVFGIGSAFYGFLAILINTPSLRMGDKEAKTYNIMGFISILVGVLCVIFSTYVVVLMVLAVLLLLVGIFSYAFRTLVKDIISWIRKLRYGKDYYDWGDRR